MIAYNNDWLRNKYIRMQADEALHEGCIAVDTHGAIYKAKEVKFYTPNYFVRIGLAVLALVIVSFVAGLFGLITGGAGSFSFLLIFMGAACYIAAEVLISSKSHYNSGLDNMLVWMAALLLCIGFNWAIGWDNSIEQVYCLVAFIVCLALAIRFADVLLSIVACLSFLCFIFYACQHTGAQAKALTPFLMMLVSGGLYFVVVKIMKFPSLLLYRTCHLCVSVFSLIALYACGNYYIVVALGSEMYHTYPVMPVPVPMGWFFWMWTFVVPFVYIGMGIRNRNTTLIRTGIPLVAAAVLTFRHYHSVISPELALLLAGIVLFAVSWSLIKYLRTPKNGFTFNPVKHSENNPVTANITGELMDRSKDVFLHK